MEKPHKLLAKANRELAAGRRDSATELYRKIVALAPRHLDANYLLGSVLAESGQLDEAEHYLKIAAGLMPESPFVWNNVGNVSLLRGDEEGALAAWTRALKFKPDLAEAWSNMGLIHNRHGRLDEAEACMRKATALQGSAYAWSVLAAIAEKKGRTEEAAAICRSILQAVPDHSESQFMLARLEGSPMPQAPREMIRSMFDAYADRFDRHLLGDLEYRTPGLLRELLDGHLAGRRFGRVADLGCGTGLMGLEIRGRASSLVGVDLSPRMLEAAARHEGVYQRLVEAEIVDFLRAESEPFELIIATDVLVYLGALEAWFAAAAEKSAKPGWLAFSTERAASEELGDWVLRATGRYAHATAYVERCAESTGWRVVDRKQVILRREADGPVPGEVFLMAR